VAVIGFGLGLVGLPLIGVGDAMAAPAPGVPWTWGSNDYGQLGNGSTSSSPSGPAAVKGPAGAGQLDGVVDEDGGREHEIALTSTGDVYTWGSDQEGQLGDDPIKANKSLPTRITVPCSSGTVTAVAAGHNSSVALCGDGSVYDWGLNTDGQLGDGTRTTRTTPVKVASVTTAVAVAAGRDMTYAVLADGTMRAWGDNAFGELGDGTTTDRLLPVAVQGVSGVASVAGGRDHAVVLEQDGSVWAFGANAYGALGDGSTTNRTSPVQVITAAGPLTGVTQVDAGADHSYALLANGGVMAWGRNYRDELGDGTTTTRSHAVPVLDVSRAVSIGSGRDSGVAVLSDGTVQAWGHNAYGQLGSGTTNSPRGVTVPGVSGAVKAVGGGSEYLSVLVGSGPAQPQPPVARFTSDCQQLSCHFDAGGSTDDGTITSYAWDFGDGGTASGAVVDHPFTAGDHEVTLTVTDDGGLVDHTTRTVTVTDTPPPPPPSVVLDAVKAYDANVTKPTVTVRSAVGEQVVVFMSTNRAASAATPSGWTLRGTVADGTDVRSWVFTRQATAATTTFTATLDAISKTNLTALSYSGAGVPAATGNFETGTSSSHTSPATSVSTAGSTVVSYWADKPSATHGWTLPAPVTQRSTSATTGSGLLTSTVGDSSGVAAGSWSGVRAVAGLAAAKEVAWTVVLPPA
jgi:alpha-tubulin suppressor-like RCC1 family protein